jgi:hypothetical protein
MTVIYYFAYVWEELTAAMLSTHLCRGYRSRWSCTSSRVGCSRWLQWVVPLQVRQKLEYLWIVLQLGRRLRDSWMGSCWGRLGGGPWTCATFALQSKQLSARVISTEIVRTTDFPMRQAPLHAITASKSSPKSFLSYNPHALHKLTQNWIPLPLYSYFIHTL